MPMQTGNYRGAKPNYVKPSRMYAQNRVCAAPGCETRLSRYNPRDKCWTHADFKVPRLRGRVVTE